jgi:hypothetical protein
LNAATIITEFESVWASAEKVPVVPELTLIASAMNNPTSAPVLLPSSCRSCHVLLAGSVVGATVPFEATLGAVAASIVVVVELSPWAIIATRSSFAPAVLIAVPVGSVTDPAWVVELVS